MNKKDVFYVPVVAVVICVIACAGFGYLHLLFWAFPPFANGLEMVNSSPALIFIAQAFLGSFFLAVTLVAGNCLESVVSTIRTKNNDG